MTSPSNLQLTVTPPPPQYRVVCVPKKATTDGYPDTLTDLEGKKYKVVDHFTYDLKEDHFPVIDKI